MSSALAKYVSKRFLGETVANNFGHEDPYFETVPATRLNGKPSKKTKKRRKALPPGLTEHDAKVLTKVKRRAYYLDMSLFSCCGIRFGWSSVIGIIPFAGDAIDAFMAMMVLRTCEQIEGGLPSNIKVKMLINICLDFGIGIMPIIGDLADGLFKANTRNAVELEKHLRQKGAKLLKAQGQHTSTIDASDPAVFDQQIMEERGPPPAYPGGAPTQLRTQAENHDNGNGHGRTNEPPTRQAVPTTGNGQAAEDRGGWFSGFRGQKKKPDIEHGGESRRADQPLPNLPPAGSQR